MNNATHPPQAKRSELVTIFAWLNIGVCALSVLVLLALMALFATVVPTNDMLAAMHSPEWRDVIPPSAEFAMRHIQAVFGAFLALSVVTLIASFALLKRKNWARLFWIGTMALIVVWCIGGLFYQPDMSSFMPGGLANTPPEVQAQMKSMMATMNIYGYVMSVVQAGIFSWAIWRFCSRDIRSEFQ